MKFYLKVHSIIGGAPGEPGSPGGAVPGGDIGFGFGPGGSNGGFSHNSEHVGFINDLTSLMPAVNLMSAVLFGFTGLGFGDIAQGDPNFSPGNTGPGTTGAQGGGPTGPVSQTLSTITQALAAPAPVEPPVTPPLVDDRQRKRVGRQETILTSRSALSDAPTFRPTLLGQ